MLTRHPWHFRCAASAIAAILSLGISDRSAQAQAQVRVWSAVPQVRHGPRGALSPALSPNSSLSSEKREKIKRRKIKRRKERGEKEREKEREEEERGEEERGKKKRKRKRRKRKRRKRKREEKERERGEERERKRRK